MRTHCKHGHPWNKKNVYTNIQGYQSCRVCASLSRIKHEEKYPWLKHLNKAKKRCSYKKEKQYRSYWGRGIKCFLTKGGIKFLWFRDRGCLMKRPSIDRINNNKNYVLENCQFLELEENSRKDNIGEKSRSAKLKEWQVKNIRELYRVGIIQSQLAKMFKISESTISAITTRTTWKYV